MEGRISCGPSSRENAQLITSFALNPHEQPFFELWFAGYSFANIALLFHHKKRRGISDVAERGGVMMKSFSFVSAIFMVFILMPAMVNAQDNTAGTIPPLSQPLVREGSLAISLADALKIGSPENEAEAESALSEAGIAPRNGWIADYPVTPDIVAELQGSISEAASSGELSMGNDRALKTFQDLMSEHSLSVTGGISDQGASATSAPNYPDSEIMSDYYYEEGPPVVTYYSPPPDYTYLYTWVPYPFWCSGFWFTGFFVLSDFHVRVHRHGHDELISNHFRDFRTGRVSRIDAVNRARGRTLALSSGASGTLSSAPSARTNTGSTCSSCHHSTFGGMSSSSGSSRGSAGGGSRGSFGSFSGGSFGGGWRR